MFDLKGTASAIKNLNDDFVRTKQGLDSLSARVTEVKSDLVARFESQDTSIGDAVKRVTEVESSLREVKGTHSQLDQRLSRVEQRLDQVATSLSKVLGIMEVAKGQRLHGARNSTTVPELPETEEDN